MLALYARCFTDVALVRLVLEANAAATHAWQCPVGTQTFVLSCSTTQRTAWKAWAAKAGTWPATEAGSPTKTSSK